MDNVLNFSGFLIEWPNRSIQKTDLLNCRDLKFCYDLQGTRWEEYEYRSQIPLRGEDERTISLPLSYRMLCRRSGCRMTLLAVARPIVEHILNNEFKAIFRPSLIKVPIGVDPLVRALVEKPTIYSLSFVHSRLPGYGASLRSISLYGDDIAEATLFKEIVSSMDVFSCGLRQVAGGPELIRLGSDGSLSFYFTGPDRCNEVEAVLSYLKQQKYLPNYIWEE